MWVQHFQLEWEKEIHLVYSILAYAKPNGMGNEVGCILCVSDIFVLMMISKMKMKWVLKLKNQKRKCFSFCKKDFKSLYCFLLNYKRKRISFVVCSIVDNNKEIQQKRGAHNRLPEKDNPHLCNTGSNFHLAGVTFWERGWFFECVESKNEIKTKSTTKPIS